MTEALENEAKAQIRRTILCAAGKLEGIPYLLGAKWTDLSKPPENLDCSGLVEGCYHYAKLSIPDGSQAQYNFTIATDKPQAGDLAFFAKDKDITKIYHVGIVFDDKSIIEARAFDGRDWTGKVILRSRNAWENWKNFVGYRTHPKLV